MTNRYAIAEKMAGVDIFIRQCDEGGGCGILSERKLRKAVTLGK